MAVYLFSFHAYRSWMPDRPRGYVRRGEGILPRDRDAAQQYEANATQAEVVFTQQVQDVIIATVSALCVTKDWRLHQIATDPSHVHMLVSWRGFCDWKEVRRRLKYELTSQLNAHLGKRKWFSAAGSRKHVRDRKHFNHLMRDYLPKHPGQRWCESAGI